jgi:hypothetical protein
VVWPSEHPFDLISFQVAANTLPNLKPRVSCIPASESHGDAQYKQIWERHKMDQWTGKAHYIAKKWDAEKDDWVDLGDGWT